MKKSFTMLTIVLLTFILSYHAFAATPATSIADINEDGICGVADALLLLDVLLNDKASSNIDVNNDGKTNFTDVICVLSITSNRHENNSDNNNCTISVLDSGKCGENLDWELLSNGTLHIYGTGPMYDYVKYTQPSPWYKYRDEPFISEDGTTILNPDGSTYLKTDSYYSDNPNGYKIKNIIIEKGITYIGDWAFYRVCVDELTIPEGVIETGIFCIRFSPTIKTITLPNSLKVLDDFAISRNQVLTTINFGNSLEKIGTGGLNNNVALESAIFPDTLVQINSQLSPSYTGANINYNATGLMENCISLKTVSFGKVDKIPQRTCLKTAIEHVIIPSTVTSIDEYAFYNCESLKTILFDENSVCKNIDYTAMLNCHSLESIKGGVNLETLGYYAIVKSLKEFDFSSTNSSLLKSQFSTTSLKVAHIGNKITSIPVAWMAYNPHLETVYISSSVTEILDSAFAKCTSLESIYYDGTLDQWNNISKGNYWNGQIPATCTVYFVDGTSAKLKDLK